MSEPIEELDAEDWEEQVLKSKKLTVVDFWHEKCPWCLKLNPILDRIAHKYKNKMRFFKVNVLKSGENRKIAVQYGIMSTPTLMFFSNGKPIGQIIGFMPKESLEKTLDNMLKRAGNT